MSGDDDFLSRWSRRKADARAGVPPPEIAKPGATADTVASQAPATAATPQEPLPPVDSLTPESDFRPFMKPEVEPGLRQQALKTLFRAPNFNVMDGLDTYIDDYSKPDPLPASWLAKMNQMERLGDFAKDLLEEAPEGEKTPRGSTDKAEQDQEVAKPPSTDALDTADVVVPAPPVPE